jgi:hypothetical protein
MKTVGIFMTPHAKLLALIADQVGVPAVPSAGNMLVRTGDLGVVISALDSLNDCRMNLSCDIHYLQYCASRTSRGQPSGLEELLEAYKGAWMKLERRKLCEAVRNQPPSRANGLYLQAGGQGVPVSNNCLPNNAVLGGFPENSQPVRHPEPENNPFRRVYVPNANELTGNGLITEIGLTHTRRVSRTSATEPSRTSQGLSPRSLTQLRQKSLESMPLKTERSYQLSRLTKR